MSKAKNSNNVNMTLREIDKIASNHSNYSFFELSKMVELANNKRTTHSAYYTDEIILDSVLEELPTFTKKHIKILEPSVGAGNFIPYVINKYSNYNVELDLVDIDSDILGILKNMIKKLNVPNNFSIRFINDDFLEHKFSKKYDLVLGNPPFSKITKKYGFTYELGLSRNLSSYFLEKALSIADNVVLIMPKNYLNTPEYKESRENVLNYNLSGIIDFGEKGFKGVLIETICLIFKNEKSNKTKVCSVPLDIELNQFTDYITDNNLPYWIIYRDDFFDNFYNHLDLGIFNVYRDRQITNKILKAKGDIRVLKSRNISDDGTTINNIENYDTYVDISDVNTYTSFKYYNEEVLLTPNMTYNSRVFFKPKGYLMNGSLAVLIPKFSFDFNQEDAKYISTQEYRDFLRIARNHQTRSLNIDKNSVYFYGKRRH